MRRLLIENFPIAKFFLAVGLGSLGGTAFFLLSLPLPFMLGSMIACMLGAISGLPIAAPMKVRPPMSAIIGAMIGSSITASVLADIHSLIWSILGLTLFLLVSGILSVMYFRIVAKYDFKTAYFSGMPGGLIEMVLFAEEAGGDSRKVAIIHSLRIILIVFIVPFMVLSVSGAQRITGFNMQYSLASVDVSFFLWFLLSCILGIGFGMLLRLPAKYFLGPLLVSALIHVTGWSDYKLPFEMVIVAQIVLGATIGCRFVGVSAREIINVGVVSLGSTLILIVLTAVFAAVLSMYMDYGFLTLFLSYSPGGLAEISLLALAMQIETSIVVSHHLFRIVIVGFGGPLIFLLIKKLRAL